MKTLARNIVASAVATAMLLPAVPAMAKDSHDRDRYEQNDQHDNRSQSKGASAKDNHGQRVAYTAHKFRKGEKFDRRRATNYRVVNYREYRALKAPPRGYHYVRSGNDVLLVGLTSGIVAAVVSNLIR
ncbi:RcnB family protein [Croceicoccus bisphenolivorans]|uniref:RcnB family protein n=1 Tax=Croceicoccus bisphenolivorans TaxID=1783232 RepID=UPI00082D7B2C|nr:RcnB family protein [Croceicoccus bisphenolivorans]